MSSQLTLRSPKVALLAVAVVATVLWVSAPGARNEEAQRGSWSSLSDLKWAINSEQGASTSERVQRSKPSFHQYGDRVLVSDKPAERFRDNLLEERAYITSGHSFGSSNQLITHIKLIALAARLDRIPIIDNFFGGDHGEGSELRLSEFYDLDRLSATLDLPILEWADVKRAGSGHEEELVCWQDYSGDVAPYALRPFNIKESFWPVPEWTYDNEMASLSSLETLALRPPSKSAPDGGPVFEALRDQLRARGRTPPDELPDQHLLCFDQMFWVHDGAFVNGRVDDGESIEEPSALGESWREVGRHLHYTDAFARERDAFVAKVLGKPGQEYIAVHLRQGDFIGRVAEGSAAGYIEAVEAVQEELAARSWLARAGGPKFGVQRGKVPVVFGTDSQNETFVDSLKALGWHYLDHKKYGTADARRGNWMPSQLDLAVMSNAVGFVGTRQSSFSGLARNRVISWRNGPTRMTVP